MADFKVNIKDLNKRIIIQKFATIQNENGFDIKAWVDYKTVWARKRALSGKQYWSAKASQSEDTIAFTVRYSKDLEVLFKKNAKLEYRIQLKDITYEIQFANDVQEKHEWIEIKVLEVD